jgi:hypothetical protein
MWLEYSNRGSACGIHRSIRLSSGLPRAILERVATALGLVGVLVFIVCVVALAAGATWLVVKLSPAPGSKKPKPEAEAEA